MCAWLIRFCAVAPPVAHTQPTVVPVWEFCAAFARPKRSRRARNQCHLMSKTKRTTRQGGIRYSIPVRVNSLNDAVEVPQWHPSTFEIEPVDILHTPFSCIAFHTEFLCTDLILTVIPFVQ